MKARAIEMYADICMKNPRVSNRAAARKIYPELVDLDKKLGKKSLSEDRGEVTVAEWIADYKKQAKLKA